MMSNLHELIPGAAHWPHFVRNRSEQFEARLALLEVQRSPSLFFAGMAGSRIPIAVAHGEGFAEFRDAAHLAAAQPLVTLRFADARGEPTERYPYNPNGSPTGIAGLTTPDGRFSIRSACFARCSCRGTQLIVARTRRGCGCSATRACGWGRSRESP